mmetsp:Transcript_6492/g.13558  ORF Transcript_6492/g.13558 Transcript_6492/m.13558 type:complete len:81 (-) Transcript_6492:637-879(-)
MNVSNNIFIEVIDSSKISYNHIDQAPRCLIETNTHHAVQIPCEVDIPYDPRVLLIPGIRPSHSGSVPYQRQLFHPNLLSL